MKKGFRELANISPCKTLYVNFATLPFKQAVKLPILVSRRVKIDGRLAKNAIVLKGTCRFASVLLGMGGSRDLAVFRPSKSYLRIGGTGQIVFEGAARFAPHFSLLVNDSILRFGDGFSCNNGCSFSCVEGISFGENCLLGGDVEIRDSDGHTILDMDSERGVREKANKRPVKIGRHVWICSHARILKGVEIGDDCVIAYSSVCTKSLEGNNKLIAGFPAKVIKDNISWKR